MELLQIFLTSQEKFVKKSRTYIFILFFHHNRRRCSEKAAQLLWLRLKSLKDYKIYFHFCIFFEKCDQGLSQCNFRPSYTYTQVGKGTMSGSGNFLKFAGTSLFEDPPTVPVLCVTRGHSSKFNLKETYQYNLQQLFSMLMLRNITMHVYLINSINLKKSF